jgi:hypothetical protein
VVGRLLYGHTLKTNIILNICSMATAIIYVEFTSYYDSSGCIYSGGKKRPRSQVDDDANHGFDGFDAVPDEFHVDEMGL